MPGCRNTSENAHTESGGTGRKADASTIANICADHHTLRDDSLHHLGSPVLFNRIHDCVVAEAARVIERKFPTT